MEDEKVNNTEQRVRLTTKGGILLGIPCLKAVTSARRTAAILCRRFGFKEGKIGVAWEDTVPLKKFGRLSLSKSAGVIRFCLKKIGLLGEGPNARTVLRGKD